MLFFVVMLFVLQVPKGRRTLWFAVAVIAAFAASLSTVQGFLCWPVGLIYILWNQPWARRASHELLCGAAPRLPLCFISVDISSVTARAIPPALPRPLCIIP